MWFKNLGGSHVETKGEFNTAVVIAPNEVFESSKKLDQLFPNKFQEVTPPLAQRAQDVAIDPTSAPTPEPEKSPKEPEKVEVTTEFEGAEAAGFKIFQVNVHGKVRYNIFDGEAEEPSNDKPLTGPQTTKKLAELGVTGD